MFIAKQSLNFRKKREQTKLYVTTLNEPGNLADFTKKGEKSVTNCSLQDVPTMPQSIKRPTKLLHPETEGVLTS